MFTAFILGDKTVAWAGDVSVTRVNASSTDLASRDSASEVTRFEGSSNWVSELFVGLNSGQPETVSIGKVVASASAVAFNEWR